MKKQLPFVAFSLALLGLSSCASLEHLTDDRTRLEDDEVYWNRQELFYSPIAANADPYALGEDDYYNPNSIPNANQLNGGRNPNAFWSPNLGWQLTYGLSPFSNYYNGFDNGFNSYGYGNSYYSPWGYSTYNPYGSSWGYNPNGYLSYGGYGSGFGWGGYNPYYGGGYYGNGWGSGWNNNNGGGSTDNNVNVTHIHRNPISIGQANGSGYHGGRLQKQVVTGLQVESKEPVSSFQIAGRSSGVVGGKTTEYNSGRSFSNGAHYEDDYHTGSRSDGNNNSTHFNSTNTNSSGGRSNGNTSGKGSSSPSYSAPSRGNSAPSYSAPSRSNSAPSRSNSGSSSPAPSRSSSSPSKGGGGGSSPSKGGGRK